MDEGTLWGLARVFVPLSLISIGGGPSILAEMEHQSVDVYGWLTDQDFVNLFAISRVAPGPGTLVVTLIGWKAGGWAGALAASLAFYVPSSLLVYGAARLWRHYRAAQWRGKIERGLAPLAIGLIFAGAYAVLAASNGGVGAVAMAGAATLVTLWKPWNPLFTLAAGAVVYGVFG
jgi:chromate transporter